MTAAVLDSTRLHTEVGTAARQLAAVSKLEKHGNKHSFAIRTQGQAHIFFEHRGARNPPMSAASQEYRAGWSEHLWRPLTLSLSEYGVGQELAQEARPIPLISILRNTRSGTTHLLS